MFDHKKHDEPNEVAKGKAKASTTPPKDIRNNPAEDTSPVSIKGSEAAALQQDETKMIEYEITFPVNEELYGKVNEVSVAGEFSQWNLVQMIPRRSSDPGKMKDCWVLMTKVPQKPQHIKFLVNSMWMCSEEIPRALDPMGNENNLILSK